MKTLESFAISYFQEFVLFMAPLVGLEPTTYRLTAERSTN